METLNLLGNWHERTSVYIERHLEYISESKLTARTATETVDLSCFSKYHSVDIAAGSMGEF